MKKAVMGMVVLKKESTTIETFPAVDIVYNSSVLDAFELLVHPECHVVIM